jgi:hypothetical protein
MKPTNREWSENLALWRYNTNTKEVDNISLVPNHIRSNGFSSAQIFLFILGQMRRPNLLFVVKTRS